MNLLLQDAPYAIKKVVSIFLICLLLLSVLELFIKLYHPETVAHRCSAKKKSCEKFLKIFRKTPVSESLFFNNAAGPGPVTLLERDFNKGLFLKN